ncbi:MAG: hypothetical protein K9G71_20120 [Rhodobacteraceae bacterium]|jgi:hypothetical protein|nr:hypothetical protein [Paracoccaceae bacterium]MCF8516775.1 hypothetical protein [Paracoccaceae bacterium]
MTLLTPDEFARMERLLAELLPEADAQEETALLSLHARLQTLFVAQSGLQASRDRLRALKSQKGR